MYDRIIVPVDEHGVGAALDPGVALARRLRAELTLLHVHHHVEAPPELEGLPQYRYQHVVETWDGMDSEGEVHEVEWLARKAAALAAAEPEVRVTSRVVHAPLRGSLFEEGERVMVVAAGGGSEDPDPTARELVRAGGVPVLMIPPGQARAVEAIRNVVIALDGSRFSEEVLDSALELADAMGAAVTLVEVTMRHAGLSRLLHMGGRSREAADASLRDVRDRLGRRASMDVRVVEAQNVGAALVGEVRQVEGGVLALATHGRGGLRRMILGSVAELVLSMAEVPVLVIRPTGMTTASPAEEEVVTA